MQEGAGKGQKVLSRVKLSCISESGAEAATFLAARMTLLKTQVMPARKQLTGLPIRCRICCWDRVKVASCICCGLSARADSLLEAKIMGKVLQL